MACTASTATFLAQSLLDLRLLLLEGLDLILLRRVIIHDDLVEAESTHREYIEKKRKRARTDSPATSGIA